MTEVCIVGAGPAGLSAAISCAERGLKVKVIDEFMKPGGRLLGQLHEEPNGEWWNGIETARKLFDKAQALGVMLEFGVSVYDIRRSETGWTVYTTAEILEVSVLLLATGAAEAAIPLPGWTLPGVMSIGAAQVMTNVHRVRVGQRGVIVGVNVLAVAIARELQLAGIDIAAMVLPAPYPMSGEQGVPSSVMQSLMRVAHLAPSPLLRLGATFMRSRFMQRLGLGVYPKSGFKIWGIPVQLRRAALEICGDGKVESVRIANVSPSGEIAENSVREVPVDFVCIAGGLYPLAELASVAGCPFRYVPELGGHVPLHNDRMQTPLPGLYVAGNITGIESAKVAMAQGTVAGLSIAVDRSSGREAALRQLDQAIETVRNVREQALIQFHPQVAQGRSRLQSMF